MRASDSFVKEGEGAQKQVTRITSYFAESIKGIMASVKISSPIPVLKSSMVEVVDNVAGLLAQK